MESVTANTLIVNEHLVRSAGRCVHNLLICTGRTIKNLTSWANLTFSIDKVGIVDTDTHDTIPSSIFATRRSRGLALLTVTVEDEASTTGLSLCTLISIPHGTLRARSTGVNSTLVESIVASARNSIEESVSGTGRSRYNGRDILADVSLQDISGLADTSDAVVVRIGLAGGDFNALTVEELSSSDTDTSLQGFVVALILIAVGNEVRGHALAINVTDISKNTLANDTVVGLVLTARLAATQDPEVSRLAFTLTIPKNSINATVFVGGALATDDSVSRSTDTAVALLVKNSVGRTVPSGLDTGVTHKIPSVTALASSVNEFLVPCTEGLAQSTNLLVSRLAEALPGIVVIVVSRRTQGANSSDSNVGGLTDTLLGDFTEVFINSLAWHSSASLSEGIISLTR